MEKLKRTCARMEVGLTFGRRFWLAEGLTHARVFQHQGQLLAPHHPGLSHPPHPRVDAVGPRGLRGKALLGVRYVMVYWVFWMHQQCTLSLEDEEGQCRGAVRTRSSPDHQNGSAGQTLSSRQGSATRKEQQSGGRTLT